jgi:hypothetical protein
MYTVQVIVTKLCEPELNVPTFILNLSHLLCLCVCFSGTRMETATARRRSHATSANGS